MVFVVDAVSEPSVSSSAPVIDPSSSFVSGRSKMSFTEKPVFVLVNDIFWWGGKCAGKSCRTSFSDNPAVSKQTNKQGRKSRGDVSMGGKNEDEQRVALR